MSGHYEDNMVFLDGFRFTVFVRDIRFCFYRFCPRYPILSTHDIPILGVQ
jgi:hypothetical protein